MARAKKNRKGAFRQDRYHAAAVERNRYFGSKTFIEMMKDSGRGPLARGGGLRLIRGLENLINYFRILIPSYSLSPNSTEISSQIFTIKSQESKGG